MQTGGMVILDLDGTVFRADAVTVPAVKRAFKAHGVPVPSREEIRRHIGKPAEEFSGWLSALCPEGVGAEVAAAVARGEIELAAQMDGLYPGIREALEELRADVRHMAICSNGSEDYVEAVLATYELRRHFDALRCRQAGDTDKAGMVRDLLEQLGGRPAIFIGDRIDDIWAAHRNGLPAIAAAYGYGSAEEHGRAEATAASPAELPELARRLLRVAGVWQEA